MDFLVPTMSANLTATGRPISLRYLGQATGRGTYKILAYFTSVNVKEAIISKYPQLFICL